MTDNLAPENESLEMVVRDETEGSTVHLRGRLSIESSPAFRDRLLAMLRAQPPRAVMVDFSDVAYVDGSGIATLIEGLKIARQTQRTFCLRGVRGRFLHLFEVSGMSALFEKSGCGSISTESKGS
jgi:anti-sigma B factor antagonist